MADIAKFASRFPPAIEVVDAVHEAIRKPAQFNCYMYALGAHDSAPIAALLRQLDRCFGNEFTHWLVQSRRFKATANALKINDVTLYSDATGSQHAGR